MSTPLFTPPQNYVLPLSLGGDLHVTMVYKPPVLDDAGQPVTNPDGTVQVAQAAWPPGATVAITIDTSPDPTIAAGVIDGAYATFQLDHQITDLIPSRLLWRAVLTHADGIDEVLANGTTARFDGK